MNSKTNLALIGAVSGVGLVAGLVAFGRSEPASVRDVQPLEGSAASSAPETEARLSSDRRESVATSPASMGTTGSSDPAPLLRSWEDCLNEEERPDLLRECLLAADVLEQLVPDDLPDIVCSGDFGARQNEALVDVLLGELEPRAFLAAVRRFDPCDQLDDALTSFFVRQDVRDPNWGHTLALMLGPEDLFSEQGMALLELAATQAEAGSNSLRFLLEEGARGEHGGSDASVARALVLAWEIQLDVESRLELMETVLTSPRFQGRDFETDALLGLTLNAGSFVEGDPSLALQLTERMLHDPRLGPGAAEHLLILQDWCNVPSAIDGGRQTRLVELARSVHVEED